MSNTESLQTKTIFLQLMQVKSCMKRVNIKVKGGDPNAIILYREPYEKGKIEGEAKWI